ncbi:MAG: ShlB/FhaC/HecB family hemolysin secretion/activation protein [Sphingomicrobium sp.]
MASALAAIPTTVGAQSIAPTRDELTRALPAAPERRPNLNIVGGIERSPCPLADPKYADIKVTIQTVQFDNLKGATQDELRPAWASYAGSPQPVAVLCEIRDGAATILRNKGYLAAVQVPTQRIDNGVVHMETLFARVTTVRARGQTGGAEAKLAGYLSKLANDEIFDRFRAERYLLLARDLPGYNVQLTLKPAGTGPGELIGEVSVVRMPLSADLMIQNLASAQTGRWGGQLRVQAFGLTGLGDVTSVSLYSTVQVKEQQILQLSHSFRPGNEGVVVDGLFTYAWTRPDLNAPAVVPDLKARTLYASLGARYPLVRRQSHNLWLGAGVDFLNQDVDFFGPQSRDRLRIGFLRANWDAVDLRSRRPKWRASVTAELRHGFDVLGTSNRCPRIGCGPGVLGPSRADGNPTATLARLSADTELAIGRDLSLTLSPRAQLAFSPLFAFEEFTAGNYTIGRGYDPAVLTGDSGTGLSAELRGPRIIPANMESVSVQPFVFGDAAWVWNKRTPGDPEHLKSAGGGIRASLSDRFRVEATVAQPLEKAGLTHKRGGPRVLLTLTSRLLPWR